MMKNYLLNLLQQCSEERFGQDAIEWAIVSGLVHLSYNLEHDTQEAMSKYDEIIEKYRESLAKESGTRQEERAPMERAAPGRRVKGAAAKQSTRRKHAA